MEGSGWLLLLMLTSQEVTGKNEYANKVPGSDSSSCVEAGSWVVVKTFGI